MSKYIDFELAKLVSNMSLTLTYLTHRAFIVMGFVNN